MPCYKLTIEYDGTGFLGWQKQAEGPSVQASIEKAIFRFCSESITIHCAGRTDRGVHARGQVAHVVLAKEYDPYKLWKAVNFHLIQMFEQEPGISILKAEQVEDDFHARFSATRRYYQYRIINRSSPLAIERNRAWQVFVPLDIALMQEAAKHFLGTHDFTSFRASECQAKNPVRTLDSLIITQEGDVITLDLQALSFLHHQVRNITGTLKLIGEGKLAATEIPRILEAKDRTQAGPTAPAHGLYFMKVDYPQRKP
ncbi:MAG: pseudouridine synthase [Rickettsiales bacterium]|jgi:tRNA pseudouridine38-40 synthase|nr:pseudouridine synthase [Rickettsiales bacterium]